MLFTLIRGVVALMSDSAASLEEMADEELMLAYAGGEVRAFELLVKRYERPLFNFILRSTHNQSQAEELLQDVFLKVVGSAPSYKQTAKFKTWVYTIARNACIDRARKKSKRTELSLDQPIGDDKGQTFVDTVRDSKGHVGSVDYDRQVFRKRLQEALEQLPDDQREVFLMREVSGLKFREIAEVLDCPVPTIKSRMRYALEALRGHMAAFRDHSFDEEDKAEIERVSS